jgi:hypothetical protein
MHFIYNAEGAHHLPYFRDLDFSLVSEIVNGVPLDADERTSRFCMDMQHKARRGETMTISSTNLHQHPRRTAI